MKFKEDMQGGEGRRGEGRAAAPGGQWRISQREEPQEQVCTRSVEGEGCRDSRCKGPAERLEMQGWEGTLAGLRRPDRTEELCETW